jgi:hypothetical protein
MFNEVLVGKTILEFSYSNYTVQKLAKITVEPGQEINLETFFLDASVLYDLAVPEHCFPFAP